jgi:membrane protease YdiL (CAAX protease family)
MDRIADNCIGFSSLEEVIMVSSKTLQTLLASAGVFVLTILIWRLAVFANTSLPSNQAQTERLIFSLIVCIGSIVVVGIAARMQGHGFSWLGLQIDKQAVRSFVLGVLCFLIPAGLALSVVLVSGMLSISLQVPVSDFIFYLAFIVLFVCFGEALPEELVFRGYLWGQLSKHALTWLVLLGQTLLFVLFAALIGAIGDLNNASFLGFFAFVLGLLRRASQSLYAPIGFHLALISSQQVFVSSRNLIETNNPFMLQMLLLGIIPLSASIIYLHNKFSWTSKSNTV